MNLKIIWSATAVVALGIAVAQTGRPIVAAFLGVFVAFNFLWLYYWRRLASA